MAELAGYVISYGQNPENLDQKIYVNDAYVMEYTVDGLSEGTWYFSVQAEDDNGLMSPPSDLVSKTFQS
ncbi:fibronectin type III domain-containing protein [Marinobacter confluentis]|uniref:Fibronectin type III domain-containing protein n=2 Tax=Marinobacter confluentis TaxID=1697557 RepID=A0A4Z1CAK4_9GAMM|nr:fibronectin type III domain-containing protein [Marinobacter confluentis]